MALCTELEVARYHPFTPKFKKYILPAFQDKCIGEVVRILSRIIFHLSEL